MSETKPLLTDGTFAVRRTWMHFILMPVVVCLFIGYSMFLYLRNEWTHYSLTIQVLGNATAGESFQNCSETSHNVNKTHDDYDYIQEQTAQWQTYFSVASTVPAIFCSTILPSYSDTKGRKFLLIISIVGVFIKYLICLAVIYYDLDFIYMFVAHIIEGLSGSNYTLLSGCFSFAADITYTNKERTFAITVLECTIMLCITVSGGFIGIFIKEYGYVIPMASLVGITFLPLLLLLFLPETVEKNVSKHTKSPLENFRRMFQFYVSAAFKERRSAYILLLLAFFVTSLTCGNRAPTETTYQLGLPFCWSSTYIGYFSALRHGGQGIVGAVSLKYFQFCLPNEVIVILSVVSNMGSYILEGFATTDLQMFMVPLVAVYSVLSYPLLRSMMSLMTPEDKQGALFASITTVEGIGTLAAVLLGNSIYAATVSIAPGFVFFVLAGLNAITFLLLIIYVCKKPKLDPQVEVN